MKFKLHLKGFISSSVFILERFLSKSLLSRSYTLFLALRTWGMQAGFSVSERVVEYPFVLSNVEGKDKLILDIGSRDSPLPYWLTCKGHRVCGIDVEFPLKNEKFQRVRSDATQLPFTDKMFDYVTVVSTIEHIGLGAYLDPTLPEGDFRLMYEVDRVLKVGGEVILTTLGGKKPFEPHFKSSERLYDEPRIRQLIRGFAVECRENFAKDSKGKWSKLMEARSVQSEERYVICIKLLKEKSSQIERCFGHSSAPSTVKGSMSERN